MINDFCIYNSVEFPLYLYFKHTVLPSGQVRSAKLTATSRATSISHNLDLWSGIECVILIPDDTHMTTKFKS